jgi:hypothetical protein
MLTGTERHPAQFVVVADMPAEAFRAFVRIQ